MTQSTASHRRSPSSPHAPKSKPAVRPGPHRRGVSGIGLSISKLGSGHSTRSHSRGVKVDDDFDMAASFLNFWYVGSFLSFFIIFFGVIHFFSLIGYNRESLSIPSPSVHPGCRHSAVDGWSLNKPGPGRIDSCLTVYGFAHSMNLGADLYIFCLQRHV